MRIIFLLFIFLSSTTLLASTVKARNEDAPGFYASSSSTNITLAMIADKSSDGGDSESSAIKVYIPLGGQDATHQNRSMFTTPTLIPTGPAVGSSYVLFQATGENTGTTTQFLKAAVKDSSSVYKTITLESTFSFSANSAGNADVVFNITSLCATNIDCSSIQTTLGSNYKEFYVYYFLSSTNHGSGTDITPSENSGGVYVRYYFSDRLPTGNLSLNRVYKGDSRVVVDYTGGENVNEMGDKIYKLFSFNHVAPVSAGTSVSSEGGASRIIGVYPPGLNGLLDIQNLTNNTSYNLSLGLINKFNYQSLLSRSLDATPEPIEALLQKQSCYLLTAGFAGDHPVVEYFRGVRDHVLLNNWWGRLFIRFYYWSAPKAAPFILRHPDVAGFIRNVASFFAQKPAEKTNQK